MFVTSRTHEKLRDELNGTLQELIDSRLQTKEANNRMFAAVNMFKELQAKWNDLVERVNKKGGEAFLNHGELYGFVKPSQQFTDDELRSLLQLVHPDKHNGKQSAVNMTKKINQLRA